MVFKGKFTLWKALIMHMHYVFYVVNIALSMITSIDSIQKSLKKKPEPRTQNGSCQNEAENREKSNLQVQNLV